MVKTQTTPAHHSGGSPNTSIPSISVAAFARQPPPCSAAYVPSSVARLVVEAAPDDQSTERTRARAGGSVMRRRAEGCSTRCVIRIEYTSD
ncbi:hypothetical protein GUJ93_ZPchr0001g31658 [Zizania palustris]|uniref:Uncharacterized protein n=1 Tax=Zizania palustris TaxID=103762 RepID=A0A8J5RL87_ZIZPA|nr:hypothetical protein GUJ93_ZPchr0001g31658 [Zizania palustris]